MESDNLAMAVLVAVPHFVCVASSLHLLSGLQTPKARSRLQAAALLAGYAPIAVLAWLIFPENAVFSFGVFLVLFSFGPILALFALGFFLAARMGGVGGRKWDLLSMSIATAVGVMTYSWASSGPSG